MKQSDIEIIQAHIKKINEMTDSMVRVYKKLENDHCYFTDGVYDGILAERIKFEDFLTLLKTAER